MQSMMWRLTPARSTCAPIIRMRAAPDSRADFRRAATVGRSSCAKGGCGSSSQSQRSRCRSCARSASGFTRRRERSKVLYRLMFRPVVIGKDDRQKRLTAEVVGNDIVGPVLDETGALEWADVAALGFVGSDADGKR